MIMKENNNKHIHSEMLHNMLHNHIELFLDNVQKLTADDKTV